MKQRDLSRSALALVAVAGLSTGLLSSSSAFANSAPVKIEVNPYTSTAADSSPANFARLGNSVLFAANDGVNGSELWITDGTTAGTVLLKDINTGTASSTPQALVNFGSRVIFSADDGVNGRELWITDGTAAGTTLLRDIRAGSAGSTAFSGAFSVVGSFGTPGSFVAFGVNDGSIGTEPWVTDGTTAGTFNLANINAGSTSSNASGFFATESRVYFLANEGTTLGLTGNELWSTDGTVSGTTRVTDIAPGTASSGYSISASLNGWGYGSANNAAVGNDAEPTAFNFSNAQVRRLADIRPGTNGSTSQDYTVVGNAVYFRGSSNGTDTQLYAVTFDGNQEPIGAVLVKDVNPSGNDNVSNLVAFNDLLYFTASDGVSGRELWRSDGTDAGTVRVADLAPGATDSAPAGSLVVSGKLFFTASTAEFGRELYVSDGTEGGTVRLADLRAGFANGVALSPAMIDLNGTLVFTGSGTSVGSELFSSDGTIAGTSLLKEIRAVNPTTGAQPTQLTLANGRLFFSATDEAAGRELWTVAPTGLTASRVADMNVGTSSSSPSALTAYGDDVIFNATSSTVGIEWARANATSVTFFDILPGATGGAPGGTPTVGLLNGSAYLSASDGVNGFELWRYDGINAPAIVANFNTNANAGISPNNFVTLGSEIYFSAGYSTGGPTPAMGIEFFKSDGSSVSLVEDYNTNSPTASNSSSPAALFVFNGRIFMRATSAGIGSELAVFDPAAAGGAGDMYLVQDIRPGSGSSSPSNFVNFNNTLYFTATDSNGNIQLYTASEAVGSAVVKSDAIGSTATTVVKSGNYLYFTAGSFVGTNVELWAMNPSVNGGQAFAIDLNPSGGSFPASLTDVNGVLYFGATTGAVGNELYRVTFDTNGVPNGAELVADLNTTATTASSTPANLRYSADSNRLWFTADDGSNGEELWVIDLATQQPSGCNPADIACDNGDPLVNNPGCTNSNTGPNEGDFNAFFAADGFFFQSGQGVAAVGGTCDIACDNGDPLSQSPGCTNNGVNEGDYNCFFNNLFLPCI